MRLWAMVFAVAPIIVVPLLLAAFWFGERWPALSYLAFGVPAWLKRTLFEPVAVLVCGACAQGAHHSLLLWVSVTFWSLFGATAVLLCVRHFRRAASPQRNT